MNIADFLKKRALDIGFDLAGIAPISIWPDLEFARQWVASGKAGEMYYLSNPKRVDPRLVLPSAQTVICLGLVYNTSLPYSVAILGDGKAEGGRQGAEASRQKPELRTGRPKADLGALNPNPEAQSSNPQTATPETRVPNPEPRKPRTETRVWISRYAWGKDYHEVMREKLERFRQEIEMLAPGTETRVYVDTGPVVERAFARFSGIGWMGKNTCLINDRKGSWFFLGLILTSLAVPPDLPAPDRCGSCTRCLEACPTGALIRPYVMDANRCIAYLTIEHKGSIPAEFRPGIGLNVFGCDICQDACPWNTPRERSQASAFNPQQATPNRPAISKQSEFYPIEILVEGKGGQQAVPSVALRSMVSGTRKPTPASVPLFNPPLRALASMSEDDFRRAFSHSPIKRAKYRGWLRNLCVAMGNSGNRGFVPWLERACEHPDEVVREHAHWALHRLSGIIPRKIAAARSQRGG